MCFDARKRNKFVRSVTLLSDIAGSNRAKVGVRLYKKSRIFGTIVFIFKTLARMVNACEVKKTSPKQGDSHLVTRTSK